MTTASTARRAATRAFGLLSAGLLALTGCTSAETPAPTEPSLPTSAAEPVPRTAPPVTNPVDIHPFAKRPCSLLTMRETIRLGYDSDEDNEPRSEISEDSAYCQLSGKNSTVDARLIVFPESSELNTRIKGGRPIHQQVFELRNISGLPALLQQEYSQFPGCLLTVGVAANQSLQLAVGKENRPINGDPCRRAILTAEAALTKLRPLRD